MPARSSKNKSTKKPSQNTRSSRRTKVSKTKKSMYWINISLMTVLVLSVLGYVLQIAESTKIGFTINERQRKLALYKEEIAEHTQSINRMQSAEYIAREATKLGMAPVDQIDFLAPLSSVFALNE